ncbi:MAG: hypothetical protein K8R46_11910 [Pirellulales bacterium]|nr:hypothetical protein [Pirellulales bacterium]
MKNIIRVQIFLAVALIYFGIWYYAGQTASYIYNVHYSGGGDIPAYLHVQFFVSEMIYLVLNPLDTALSFVGWSHAPFVVPLAILTSIFWACVITFLWSKRGRNKGDGNRC